MKKYNSIPRLGKATGIFGGGELYIQEKIDGANFRFKRTNDDRIGFGSKNVAYGPVDTDPEPTFEEFANDRLYELTGGRFGEPFNPDTNVDSAFMHAIEHVQNHVTPEQIEVVEEGFFGGDRLMFYGEATHKHIMEYENIPSFLGFDVYNLDAEEFVHPNRMELVFDELGLETVPMIERGIPAEDFSPKTFEYPESEYLGNVPEDAPKIEGVVIKNPEIGERAKLRTDKFKEVHNGSGTVSDKKGDPDDLYGKTAAQHNSVAQAHKYATPARIKKHILKLHDRGHTIEMAMMEDLWRQVAEDIVEEEGDQILLDGNKTLNTKDFRSEVASRCAHVLQQFLDAQANNPDANPEELTIPGHSQ